jgi:hypothetical protein
LFAAAPPTLTLGLDGPLDALLLVLLVLLELVPPLPPPPPPHPAASAITAAKPAAQSHFPLIPKMFPLVLVCYRMSPAFTPAGSDCGR